MQIDVNNEQPQNAFASIRFSFDPGSNIKVGSAIHPVKHSASKTSTEAGMEIDCKERQFENTFTSIRFSFDSDSNVTDDSNADPEKAFSGRNSTEEGT
jgi:hypothetical protein